MGNNTVILVILLLLTLSALFSGLSLGFFTLRKNDLKRKAELGDRNAEKLYRIRKNGNLLLLYDDHREYLGQFHPFRLSGDAHLGRDRQLPLHRAHRPLRRNIPAGALRAPRAPSGAEVRVAGEIFIFIFYPVAKPLSAILDRVIGEELPTIYSKKELASIIDQQGAADAGATVDEDERRIVKGALSYSDKTAGDIMTPRTAMIAVEMNERLDAEKVDKLRESGIRASGVCGNGRQYHGHALCEGSARTRPGGKRRWAIWRAGA